MTILLVLLLLALIMGLGAANARFARTAQDPNEFLPRWEGANAWLTRGRSPYDPQVSLSAQRRLYGREADPEQGETLALFAYPFPAMLLYAPWGALDYPSARAGWMTLLEVMLVAAGLLAVQLTSWRPPPLLLALVVIFGVAWSPGIRSIVSGHVGILALVCSLAAIVSIERGWDRAGGVLLVLALADPIVGLLVLLVALTWAVSARRWGLIGVAVVTAGLVSGVSLLVMPGWPLAWLQQLAVGVEAGAQSGSSLRLPILGPESAPGILAAFLALAILWTIWRGWGKGTRWLVWSTAFTLVLGDWLTRLAVGSSPSIYLLPAIVFILASLGQRPERNGSWMVAGGLILIGVGSWIPYLGTSASWADSTVGGSVGPALAALGLLWVRWWVTRGAEIRGLSFEDPNVG